MPSLRSRATPPVFAVLLGAATALALAGCTNDGASSDSVKSLSDLNNKEQSMLKVGDASRAGGDCVAAIRFYRLVKDNDDNHRDAANARLGAADCELSMNAVPDAEHDYKQALKLAPQDPAPYVGLGRVYLVQHQPGEAASYLAQAIKKGADAAFVWNDSGVAYDQLRRHKEAQQMYRAGLAKFPSDHALRNNLALSLAMTNDFAEAETLLRALVAEPNTSPRDRENLALVLGLEGNTEEARRVSQSDLDGASLDNNSRFYEYARSLMTGEPVADTSAGAAPAEAARAVEPAPAPHARVAAAPVPPPVLIKDRPLTGLRTAEPTTIERARPAIAATELPATAPAAKEAAKPAITQTAALPPPATPGPATAPPMRMVGPDGGALKPAPAQPVASSE